MPKQSVPVTLLNRERGLTCLMATISPVALSIALYTIPKLPPVLVSYSYYPIDTWLLTAQFLQDLVLAASRIIRHRCEDRKSVV